MTQTLGNVFLSVAQFFGLHYIFGFILIFSITYVFSTLILSNIKGIDDKIKNKLSLLFAISVGFFVITLYGITTFLQYFLSLTTGMILVIFFFILVVSIFTGRSLYESINPQQPSTALRLSNILVVILLIVFAFLSLFLAYFEYFEQLNQARSPFSIYTLYAMNPYILYIVFLFIIIGVLILLLSAGAGPGAGQKK